MTNDTNFLRAIGDVFSGQALSLDPRTVAKVAQCAPLTVKQKEARASWLVWPPSLMGLVIPLTIIHFFTHTIDGQPAMSTSATLAVVLSGMLVPLGLAIGLWYGRPQIKELKWSELGNRVIKELPIEVRDDIQRLLREYPSKQYELVTHYFKRGTQKGQMAFAILRRGRERVVLDLHPSLKSVMID